MRKSLLVFVLAIMAVFFTSNAFAGKCPQPRKTKSAPSSTAKKAIPASADAAHGKSLYTKKAKPIACKQCHSNCKTTQNHYAQSSR